MRDYTLPGSPLQVSDEFVEEFPVLGNIWNSGVNFLTETWNDITGKTSQAKEFEQQEYLLEKEQAYNSEVAKMARMKQAGINPLTAAAGIAGSNSPQAPQVSSNTSGVANALGALTGGLDSLASAKKLNEEANQVAPLAESSIQTSDAQIERWSHENDFTDVQTEAFLIDNEYRSDLNRSELNIKIMQHEKMKKEADYIQGQKDYLERLIKSYEEQIAVELDLTKKRALEAEKNAMFAEERARHEKLENDFVEKYGYRRDQPFDCAMLSLWFNGDYDKVLSAEKFMFDLKYGEAYNVAKAGADASWYKLPSTVTEALQQSIHNILSGNAWWKDYFKDGVSKLDELRKDTKAYNDFREAFFDAKNDLYNIYRHARKEYRSYKYSGASDMAIAEAERKMKNAKDAYDSFTEEKFADEIVKNISPRE